MRAQWLLMRGWCFCIIFDYATNFSQSYAQPLVSLLKTEKYFNDLILKVSMSSYLTGSAIYGAKRTCDCVGAHTRVLLQIHTQIEKVKLWQIE